MPTAQTSLAAVSYTDEGSGPPILLLHAALHDHTDFDPVRASLGQGRRVLTLDWPGHGASPPPPEPLRAVEFGDLLVEFADLLDLRGLVVVGNSVGGYAACRLALERPERVSGVVLVNTGGFTPHSVFTRFFCAVMGRPAVVRRRFPRSSGPTRGPRIPPTRPWCGVWWTVPAPRTARKSLPRYGRASPSRDTTCGRAPPGSPRRC